MDRSSFRTVALIGVAVLVLGGVLLLRWWFAPNPVIGKVLDEALQASPQRLAASFPAADEDYFRDMDQTGDGPIALSPEEVKGRNTWIVWSAGNDRMWDVLGEHSVGALDFLKVLSSHPSQKYSRALRPGQAGRTGSARTGGSTSAWSTSRASTSRPAPDPNRDGALARPAARPTARPIRSRTRRSIRACGSARAARRVNGKTVRHRLVLRLRHRHRRASGCFPNPAFDEAAARRWDPERYYTDPTYYNDQTLVRPYRVGMSCGLCHVGPNPIKPPADPNNPAWANLSSNVGAQYFWIDRIFYEAADYSSFAFQLFHSSRPGSLDTSFVSTDNINNPRTMNAVYGLLPRLLHARRWGKETLAGGGLRQQAVQRLREGRAAGDALRVAGDGVDATRAQGRRPTRSARWARSTAST